jgi:hypothetical protein
LGQSRPAGLLGFAAKVKLNAKVSGPDAKVGLVSLRDRSRKASRKALPAFASRWYKPRLNGRAYAPSTATPNSRAIRRHPLPIPSLTSDGLLPVGIHDCTLSEIEATYARNYKRRQVWGRFSEFLEHLKGIPGLNAVYVDGSFVTDKEKPSDVDIVIEYDDGRTRVRLAQTYWFLRQKDKVKHRYSVDVLGCLKTEKSPAMVELFQMLRVEDAIQRGVPPDTRKGILRITPP